MQTSNFNSLHVLENFNSGSIYQVFNDPLPSHIHLRNKAFNEAECQLSLIECEALREPSEMVLLLIPRDPGHLESSSDKQKFLRIRGVD